jgi:hypothetical protein
VQQWIAMLVGVAGISSLLTYELAIRAIYNTPVIHVFTVLELSLYTWIYHKSMPQWFTRRITYFIIAGFTLLAIANTIFLESIWEFNANARALESVILIVLSLIYYYQLYREMKVYDLHLLPTFWVAAGVLVNFSTNLLFFSFFSWLLQQDHIEAWDMALRIHSVSNIILYLLLAIGLWVNPAKAKIS